jgi:Brix domain
VCPEIIWKPLKWLAATKSTCCHIIHQRATSFHKCSIWNLGMASSTPLPNFQRKGRVNRLLKKLEPQLVENTKRALIVKGTHTSQSIIDVLKDFSQLLKPNCKVLGRKNEITPFEDANSLEFLTTKNDCSLFVVGSHSKKRVNNLIMVSVAGMQCTFFRREMLAITFDNFLVI